MTFPIDSQLAQACLNAKKLWFFERLYCNKRYLKYIHQLRTAIEYAQAVANYHGTPYSYCKTLKLRIKYATDLYYKVNQVF